MPNPATFIKLAEDGARAIAEMERRRREEEEEAKKRAEGHR